MLTDASYTAPVDGPTVGGHALLRLLEGINSSSSAPPPG